MTQIELKSQIKFHLNNLSADNGHHKFENIALEIASLKVAPNLKRATGPVSKGQGKTTKRLYRF